MCTGYLERVCRELDASSVAAHPRVEGSGGAEDVRGGEAAIVLWAGVPRSDGKGRVGDGVECALCGGAHAAGECGLCGGGGEGGREWKSAVRLEVCLRPGGNFKLPPDLRCVCPCNILLFVWCGNGASVSNCMSL